MNAILELKRLAPGLLAAAALIGCASDDESAASQRVGVADSMSCAEIFFEMDRRGIDVDPANTFASTNGLSAFPDPRSRHPTAQSTPWTNKLRDLWLEKRCEEP